MLWKDRIKIEEYGERDSKACNWPTIFCPPGPLPFRNASVISSSLISGGRGGICFANCIHEAMKLRTPHADVPLLKGPARHEMARSIVRESHH